MNTADINYPIARKSVLAVACFAVGLVGCVATRSDLSAPCRWQEIEGETVAVATADRMLPIVTDDRQENRWASWFLVDTKRKVVTVSPWDAPIRCTCRYCRTLYGHEVPDFVWGNDRVEFFVDDGNGVKAMKRGLRGVSAALSE